MQSGKLRKRLIIQQRSSTQDQYNQPLTTWSDVATVWGSIQPLTGRELIAGQAVNSEISHLVEIRYMPGITAAMRISYNGRFFNITSPPINENERNRMITLMCSEGLNEG